MFGQQSHSGAAAHLVEFRAGRMNMIGNMVHPDKRKGLVYLQSTEDSLLHFCWKDRSNGNVEDDVIIFPGEFEYKRVEQCKTGRVYVLKFKTSARRLFYWMQEPKVDRDDEYCRRINELMNKPPAVTPSKGGDNTGLQYMLNNMSQQELMQLFGGVGELSDIAALLGQRNRTDNAHVSGLAENQDITASHEAIGNGNGNSNTPAPGSQSSLNIDLSAGLAASEAVNHIISDPVRAKKLSIHLPELDDANENKKQQIKDTIASPQFQEALSSFSYALQSAQLGPVMSQFELTPEAVAAAENGNLEAFVKALEKSLPAGATMTEKQEKNSTD